MYGSLTTVTFVTFCGIELTSDSDNKNQGPRPAGGCMMASSIPSVITRGTKCDKDVPTLMEEALELLFRACPLSSDDRKCTNDNDTKTSRSSGSLCMLCEETVGPRTQLTYFGDLIVICTRFRIGTRPDARSGGLTEQKLAEDATSFKNRCKDDPVSYPSTECLDAAT